jgi:diketogulonate reductase-like aldo/keto reductase
MIGTAPAARSVVVQGVEVPTLLYGTAWKEERTSGLVAQALAAGFRGIDTANQRRHYHEAGVGEAVAAAAAGGGPRREELFLQSKYTYVEGQDARLPYDPAADEATQVLQSFASSLAHLGVERLDSLLLHGPRAQTGLSRVDVEVWRAIEALKEEGRVRLVGVCNVTAAQLDALCELADAPPAFVQNRCFARLGWDREVRDVCRAHGVVYQGFSLLTANRGELASRELTQVAAVHGVTVPQVVFRFALQLEMIALTGTTDPDHMREDLAVYGFELTPPEVAAIERLSG